MSGHDPKSMRSGGQSRGSLGSLFFTRLPMWPTWFRRQFRFRPGLRSHRFPRYRHRSSSTSGAQRGWWRKVRWRERHLRRIKTIGHIIGSIEPWIHRLNAQQGLAEFHQANVGALRGRDKSLPGVWTDDKTRNAGAVTKLLSIKLRVRIPWILRSLAVPLFNIGGNNMVVPSAPIIPCNKHDRSRPQTAIHNRLNLLCSPFRAECNVLCRMFAIGGITVAVNPRDGR